MEKRHVLTWLYAISLRLINNSSGLDQGDYDRDGVEIYDLNYM